MPPDTVQIGPLIISKSVFDALLPILTLFLGGVFGYIGKTLAENRQWKREDAKTAKEEARREKEQEAEAHAKRRAELLGIYSDAIKSLSALLYEMREGSSTAARQSEALQAAQQALSTIAVSHYDREDQMFVEFYNHYHGMMFNQIQKQSVYQLRQLIIDFSLNDPRLNQHPKGSPR